MDNSTLAHRIGAAAIEKGRTLATAESCTGGLVAAQCTRISGSSAWFDCGFVTYSLDAKQVLLGVPEETLSRYGAVSEPVASSMALGALNRSNADVSVSITGIAGPGGGEVDRPVGTVWFGWASRDAGKPAIVQTSAFDLEGSRDEIREQAVKVALEGFLDILTGS